MTAPEGFDYRERKNGEVAIFHHGKLAKMMRADDAKKFLASLKKGDAQQVMAEFAGNDAQVARPDGPGSAPTLHGNGPAHTQTEFRRKSV